MTEALLGFLAIFVLALMRMPLAFSMGLVGIVGIGLTRGWMPAMASTAQVVHETGFCVHPVCHSTVHFDGQFCSTSWFGA
jgi:hypothetical protein